MELEELKAGWVVLNERLAKNEILNERIVKEMISKRTQSALDKLGRIDGFSVCIGALITLVFLPLIWKRLGDPIMEMTSFILIETICMYTLIAGVVQLLLITAIKPESMPLRETMRRILRYRIFVKKNFLYSNIAGYGGAVAYIIIQGFYRNPLMAVTLIAGFIAGSILVYRQYVYYDRNIHTLKKGLEELEELSDKQ